MFYEKTYASYSADDPQRPPRGAFETYERILIWGGLGCLFSLFGAGFVTARLAMSDIKDLRAMGYTGHRVKDLTILSVLLSIAGLTVLFSMFLSSFIPWIIAFLVAAIGTAMTLGKQTMGLLEREGIHEEDGNLQTINILPQGL